jgi:hypothetical protein
MEDKKERARAVARKYYNACQDRGMYRFSHLARSMNSHDKTNGVLNHKTNTKEIRDEFYKRHPDMIFRDEDGSEHLMTLKSGPNQISADRIVDKLPDGRYAPHTFENIRFVPFKMNVTLKASPSEIEAHKERMATFTCSNTLTPSERRIIVDRIGGAKKRSRKPSRQYRGIALDPLFTVDEAIRKLLCDQHMLCAISGLPMLFETKSPFTISMDRIDNTQGYTYENTQFVCRFKNFSDGRARKRIGETLEDTNERVKRLRFI